MILECNCDIAYKIMMDKYKFFILKKIRKFYIIERFHDDFLQEGFVTLNKAIYSFSDVFNKTFLRYFELLLERDFFKIKNSSYYKNNELVSEFLDIEDRNIDIINEEITLYKQKELGLEFNKEIDKVVYINYFLLNYDVSYIREKYNYTTKKIYNSIYKIKDILRKSIDN